MLLLFSSKNAQIDGAGQAGEGAAAFESAGGFCDLSFCGTQSVWRVRNGLIGAFHLPCTVDSGVFASISRQGDRWLGDCRASRRELRRGGRCERFCEATAGKGSPHDSAWIMFLRACGSLNLSKASQFGSTLAARRLVGFIWSGLAA